ncbi:hypothetical protein KY290_024831 [Solanum tuberosum]|uniref:Uncharacterized protein n=1 Tax=Solanum tuberosum TaxID=4113 RepID=A0ABQ7URS9_SOLTU|nr:hypothetical protein KY284_023683 [Solanum tuberosum]KAH0754561.1 hypothetical protein KY290_024831 [Solanum tuberosum]
MSVDMKTKYGGKIIVDILEDIQSAVGSRARDIVNYCGLTVRSTISFRDGNWPTIFAKYGEVMWLKVKDKFEIRGGRQEHVLQGFVINTMQRLLRAWKIRLHAKYLRYKTDKDRLSHPPNNVAPEDWVHLVRHFGSPEFQLT